MFRILIKEEYLNNDVPLTKKRISIKYLTEIHGFDHHMLKLVYPLFGKRANHSKENSINLQNKTIKANAKIKTQP